MIYRNDHYGLIDRFCAKHPRFGVQNLMLYVGIAQVTVFFLDLFARGRLGWLLCFWGPDVLRGQIWRMVTFVIAPNSSNPFYLLLGCYVYYWTGQMLEREWGTARFNLFYLCGTVLSSVFALVLTLIQPELMSVLERAGLSAINLAYYLNLSIFLVIATLFSEAQVLFMFVLPIKMKWLALIDVALILVEVIQYGQRGWWSFALFPLASFVNYFIFTWPFWSMKLGFVRRRADPQVINFKRAKRQAEKKARETGGYMHKCAVCGITDQDDPNMEFRYCSKCDGYYCYCANHINNHIHIRQD